MRMAIIDYGSGHLHSVAKAFERVAYERAIMADIEITDDAGQVSTADRIVLPGVGAYADCSKGLHRVTGVIEVPEETVLKGGRPFLGICVGMPAFINTRA